MLSRVEHEIIQLLPGYHIISYDILLCQLSTKDLFTHRDSERGCEWCMGNGALRADPGLFKGHYKISQLKGNTGPLCWVRAHFVEFYDVIRDISVGRP